jgi:hypothetical protein
VNLVDQLCISEVLNKHLCHNIEVNLNITFNLQMQCVFFLIKVDQIRIHVFILTFFYSWRHDLSRTILVGVYYTVLHI